jgi:mono/diheme cytochrome c family protein
MLLVVAVGIAYAVSEWRFRKHFEVPLHGIAVPTDSASVARGRHLATVRGCVGCHGVGLVGHVEVDDPMLGRLAGPNLTNGRRGDALADTDWERAVRHGVRADGAPLLIMPASEHTGMSDEDLGALIAYARSLPSAPMVPPPSKAGPVLRGLFAAGMVLLLSAEEIDHSKTHPAHVDPAPTPEYGAYLAPMCKGCHGPQLSGGKIPGGPPDWKPAANITPAGIGPWTEANFITALRTGHRPDGSMIDEQMPWKMFRQMNDTELRAIYAYLRQQPSQEYGHR